MERWTSAAFAANEDSLKAGCYAGLDFVSTTEHHGLRAGSSCDEDDKYSILRTSDSRGEP